MSLREKLARIIAREGFGAESIWESKVKIVDLLLAEIEKTPEPEIHAWLRVLSK